MHITVNLDAPESLFGGKVRLQGAVRVIGIGHRVAIDIARIGSAGIGGELVAEPPVTAAGGQRRGAKTIHTQPLAGEGETFRSGVAQLEGGIVVGMGMDIENIHIVKGRTRKDSFFKSHSVPSFRYS